MLKAPGAELCQNACGVVNEQKIFCSHQCSPDCSMNKFRSYMSHNLSAKYYQENKEIPQKRLVKDIKTFLKKKKKVMAIWSWKLQNSVRRWKSKACWAKQKHYTIRKKNALL